MEVNCNERLHNRGVEEEKWIGKKVEWMWAKEREKKNVREADAMRVKIRDEGGS